jgi:chemotaxis signal transduction protein
MQDFRSMGLLPSLETLELVLIKLNDTDFGVRASSVKRLQRLNPSELESPDPDAHPALRGYVYNSKLPILDLRRLLEPGNEPTSLNKEEQIIIVEYDNRRAGFIVDQAQEVMRAGLAELDVLPLIVERSRLRPAAWALWRKKDEIIILVEPTECFSADEWSQVLDKG